jgi:membrane associated rhomboid family serine protease
MKDLFSSFKQNFTKQDNGLIQLILINVVVFVFMGIVYVISTMSGNEAWFNFLNLNISLPSNFNTFITKPWTLISYFFAHSMSPFHILFNMLFLFWFGKLIHEYIGNRRLINIYLLGGIVGGIVYLLLYNFVPYFEGMKNGSILIGASGAVYAVATAAATLLPHYSFHLIFLGPVRIAFIVAFFIFVSFLSSVGANAGGNLCHLGGALLGFIYIKQLQSGRDLGKPINWIAKFIRNRRSNLKVSYRQKENPTISEKDIDAILDKINRTGYASLTKDEKEKLYKASQK